MAFVGLPKQKNHQTALVIDARKGLKDVFHERVTRMLSSVNGENIKADVYSLIGNSDGTGPGLVPGVPWDAKCPQQSNKTVDVELWARNCGYTMLVFVKPLN